MGIAIIIAVSCVCIVLQSHEEENRINKISNKKDEGKALNEKEIKFLKDYGLDTLNKLQKIKTIAKKDKEAEMKTSEQN
jgi:hypothetical protein